MPLAAARRAETASVYTRCKQLYLSQRSTVLLRGTPAVDCKGQLSRSAVAARFSPSHSTAQPKRRRRNARRDAAALQTRWSRRRRHSRSYIDRTMEEETPRLAPRGPAHRRPVHVARQEQPVHQINTRNVRVHVPLRSLSKSVSVNYLLRWLQNAGTAEVPERPGDARGRFTI